MIDDSSPANNGRPAERDAESDAKREARRRLRRALDVVRAAVRADELWRPGDCVVLGCSAGIDSIVAWELLARLQNSLGHVLHVVQIDHGLRDDTQQVSAAMQAMASRLDMAWQRVDAPITVDAPQLEANARVARYVALERIAAQKGAAVIAIAHHADDQAETVLMRLARGAGVDALGAMRSERLAHHGETASGTGNEVRVVRPFLGLRRSEIAAIARDHDLVWVDDPHNDDRRHERNRIRHEILPQLDAIRPGASAGITRSARHAAAAADAVDHWLQVALKDHGRWVHAGHEPANGIACGFALPTRLWPLQTAALGVLLASVSRTLGAAPPSDRATRQVCAWLKVATIGSVMEIRDFNVIHRDDDVVIVRTDVAHLPRGTYLGNVGSRRHHAPQSGEATTGDDETELSGSRVRARSKR